MFFLKNEKKRFKFYFLMDILSSKRLDSIIKLSILKKEINLYYSGNEGSFSVASSNSPNLIRNTSSWVLKFSLERPPSVGVSYA